MKKSFYRYNNSIIKAQLNEPNKSYFQILFKKFNLKIRSKYNLFRSIVLKDSTFSEAQDLYMCSLFPKKVIDEILIEFHPRSILDIGCGTGVSLKYFLNQNVDATGIENSKMAITESGIANKIIRHNLKKKLDLQKKFDLVWSFEVIEHIHPQYENIFLNTLIRHADRVIISAAKPGQGGHGHFNEQLPEYWIKKFSVLQFQLNHKMTESLRNIHETHAANLLVFEKKVYHV